MGLHRIPPGLCRWLLPPLRLRIRLRPLLRAWPLRRAYLPGGFRGGLCPLSSCIRLVYRWPRRFMGTRPLVRNSLTRCLAFFRAMAIVSPIQHLMNFKSTLILAAAVSTAAFMSSCSSVSSSGGGLAAYHAYDRPTKRPTNPSNVRVKVSLSKQRTYVMEGSEVLLAMPVSVGAPGSVTPTG